MHHSVSEEAGLQGTAKGLDHGDKRIHGWEEPILSSQTPASCP